MVAVLSLVFGGAGGGLAGWWAASKSATPAVQTPPPSPGQELSKLFTRVSASVVDIETTIRSSNGQVGTAAGSGFVYRADGLVATAAHVVKNAETITVTFADSDSVRGEIVGLSTAEDLALVKVPVTGLTALTLGNSDALKVGDLVIAIGNALALKGSPSLAVGIVSGLNRTISTQEATLTGLIQTSAGISSGDSGGPLLTPNGEVVGINDAAAGGNEETVAQNIGFAIPSNTAQTVFSDMLTG